MDSNDYRDIIEYIVNGICGGNGAEGVNVINDFLNDIASGRASRQMFSAWEEYCEVENICPICGNNLELERYKEMSDYMGCDCFEELANNMCYMCDSEM